MGNLIGLNQKIVPTLWLITAKEYFAAVQKISLNDAENELQVRHSSPAYTLLAYAFELTFKTSIHLDGSEFEKNHDLESLLSCINDDIKNKIPIWADIYVDQNRDFLGYTINETSNTELLDVIRPRRSFEEEIHLLNCWTDRPFLCRYPQVGWMEDGVVNIKYIHAIGCDMVRSLVSITLEK